MLKEILNKIVPRGKFAHGVIMLAGGNSIGQLISFAVSPILTRLYSPDDFGLLAIYLSLTTIISVVICLRYETAIALPRSEEEAANVASLSMLFALGLSLLSAVLVFLYGNYIVELMGMPELSDAIWLLPLSLFLLGVFSSLSYLTVRKKQFALLGRTRVAQVLTSVVTQIGWSFYGAIVLVFGQLASQLIGCVLLGVKTIKETPFSHVSVGGLGRAMLRYRRFPLISTWAALLSRTSSQLPTLLFAIFFGPAVAGLFALAMRVVNAPSGVLSKALHYVFLSTVADAHVNGKAGQLTASTFGRLTTMTVPPLMFFACVAPGLFKVLFGEEWLSAGQFAQWIVLSVYCSLVVAPLMVLFSVLEKQAHEFVLQLFIFLIRLAALCVGWLEGSPILAVALYACGSLIGYMVFLYWTTVTLEIRVGLFLRPLGVSVLIGGIVCLPQLLAKWYSAASPFPDYLLILSFCFLSIYLSYVYLSYRKQLEYRSV